MRCLQIKIKRKPKLRQKTGVFIPNMALMRQMFPLKDNIHHPGVQCFEDADNTILDLHL